MRTGHLNVSRPPWYDRGPSVVGKTAIVNGPVATGQVWVYTVPTLRKAYLDFAGSYLARSSEATTAGVIGASIHLEDNTALEIARILDVGLQDNVPGADNRVVLPAWGVLTAGMFLRAFAGDTSTGGLSSTTVTAKLTEYDS